MDANELREHYKRLLEAAKDPVEEVDAAPDVEKVQAEDPELQAATSPEAQTDEVAVAEQKMGPRFPPNPHRFAYRQGEVVNFYDDAGNLVKGTVAGPPVGDRYDVMDANGNQQEVLKSELFYPAEALMAEQPMADSNTA
jgi:hypothetical protein